MPDVCLRLGSKWLNWEFSYSMYVESPLFNTSLLTDLVASVMTHRLVRKTSMRAEVCVQQKQNLC